MPLNKETKPIYYYLLLLSSDISATIHSDIFFFFFKIELEYVPSFSDTIYQLFLHILEPQIFYFLSVAPIYYWYLCLACWLNNLNIVCVLIPLAFLFSSAALCQLFLPYSTAISKLSFPFIYEQTFLILKSLLIRLFSSFKSVFSLNLVFFVTTTWNIVHVFLSHIFLQWKFYFDKVTT